MPCLNKTCNLSSYTMSKEEWTMNNLEQIKNITACARSHLAQTVSVRLALKTKQDDISALAYSIIRDPTCIKGYADTLTRETQALFKNFDTYISVCQPDYDPGHLFNMSTVLLANSIIQKFIKDIFDVMQPLFSWSRRNWKYSLTSQLNTLFISNSENSGNPLLQYDGFLGKFKHVKFLDQLRHIIIHNRGFVDKKFYKNCGIDPTTMQRTFCNNELWGLPSDWTDPFFTNDPNEFTTYFVLGDQVHLPINRVFGLLSECFVFIDDVSQICISELT